MAEPEDTPRSLGLRARGIADQAAVSPTEWVAAVLSLLWRGIAEYARQHQARFLIGCSSLTSQDCGVGAATWQRLSVHLAPPPWRTQPQPGFHSAFNRLRVF